MLNKKSEANLEIAVVCLDKKDASFFAVGISRAYYAIFQATKYFLEKNDFDYGEFKKKDSILQNQRDYSHGGIRKALAYFIQSKGFNSQDDLKFINEMLLTFYKLYNWRRKGDYEEGSIYKKDLKIAIKRAERFIRELKKYDRRGEIYE